MVTEIHKGAIRRLFLREHRKAKGVSAPAMAGRMGMERESLLRLEREWRRCGPGKQAKFAAALDIDPEELWRLPPPKAEQSIDGQIDEMRQKLEELAKKVKKTGT